MFKEIKEVADVLSNDFQLKRDFWIVPQYRLGVEKIRSDKDTYTYLKVAVNKAFDRYLSTVTDKEEIEELKTFYTNRVCEVTVNLLISKLIF